MASINGTTGTLIWLILICQGFFSLDALTVRMSTEYSDTDYPGREGTNFTMLCSWAAGGSKERITNLFFKRENSGVELTIFSYFVIANDKQISKREGFDGSRMTAVVNTGNSEVRFSVSSLKCSDEGVYSCIVEGENNAVTPVQDLQETKTQTFVMKVEPVKPVISFPASHPYQENVLEYSEVLVDCATTKLGSAVITGGLIWKIYRNDNPETLQESDPRLTYNPTPDTANCKQSLSSRLRLANVTRADQDLVVACFLYNSDFKPQNQMPAVCETADYCDQTEKMFINYPVSQPSLVPQGEPYQGGSVTMICQTDSYPAPSFVWTKGNETITEGVSSIPGESASRLTIDQLSIEDHSGVYDCTASNTIASKTYSMSKEIDIVIASTPPPSTEPTTQSTTTDGTDPDPAKNQAGGGGGDDDTVIIVVVVVVVVVLVVLLVVGVIVYRRRNAKGDTTEEPRKPPPSNASSNLAYVNNSQPDLVADDKYRIPSLNNSFDVKNEDGLMYADLTYDNRPRSRRPLAIGDNMSDYSDIQLPQV